MIVKTYKADRTYSDAQANVIGRFLDERFGDDPRTPLDVVTAAKPKRSPIHAFFEWDDKTAAEHHRIDQARLMLRSIKVVFANGVERPETRAYHRVVVSTGEDGSRDAYVPAGVVWASADYSTQVLARAKAELLSWTARYEEYAQLAGVVMDVREIAEGIAA